MVVRRAINNLSDALQQIRRQLDRALERVVPSANDDGYGNAYHSGWYVQHNGGGKQRCSIDNC